MLTKILSSLGGEIVGRMFSSVEGIFKAYFAKEISKEEAVTRLLSSLLDAVRGVETAHAESITKTYETFMVHGMKYREVRALWTAVTSTQLLVLLWHQFGIPFVVFMHWTGTNPKTGMPYQYPSSGETVVWAYALLAACLGFGVMMQRAGPGAGFVGTLKSLVGR